MIGRLLGFATGLQAEGGARHPGADYWYQPVDESSSSGIRVNADTSLRITTVYRCMDLISSSIASLPIKVGAYDESNTFTEDRRHPAWRLLNLRPNPKHTPFELRRYMLGSYLLRGNGYAELRTGASGFADTMWPVHPDEVDVKRGDNGELVYVRTTRDSKGQERKTVLRPDQMFHLRDHTTDGDCGLSRIALHRESLGLTLATQQHGARFFGNGARPGGVLETDEVLDEEVVARMSESWKASHQGLTNAHKVAILEGGTKYKPITMTAEDAQFLETRQFQVGDIGRIFGVPLAFLSSEKAEETVGTGLEQLLISLFTFALQGHMTNFEQSARRDLTIGGVDGEPEREFLHEARALLRGDVKARAEYYAKGRAWGWLSANDIRRMENENPIANGDRYLEPENMRAAGDDPLAREA